MHDQKATRHPSYQKIINLITQNYYWSELKNVVQRYIYNCHSSKRVQAPTNGYIDLLKALTIFFCSYIDVTLAFVTRLSIINDYNQIFIVFDCLIKERHYLPCTTDKNGTSTKATAQLLL